MARHSRTCGLKFKLKDLEKLETQNFASLLINRELETDRHLGSPAARRWHDVAYWGLMVVACVVFYWMNVLTPFREDDMGFSLIEGEWTRMHTLLDLLRSHATHYANTNGRLADLVPELFAGLLGKSVFNVLNALVFVLMAHILSLLSTGRRSLLAASGFMAMVGTCYPVPGETMLWMAGSANYMWAITLSLMLVYVLQHHRGLRPSWWESMALFIGGVVAGGFNEATSLGFLGGLMLYYAVNHRLINRRVVIALSGYMLGIMFIVASPGAWNRVSTDLAIDLSPGDLMSSRWYIFVEKMWKFYLPVGAFIIGIVALVVRRGRAVRQCVWTYILLVLASVMFSLGLTHERAYSPLVTVSFIIIIMVADSLLEHRPRWRLAAITIAAGLSIFTFARGIKMLNRYQAFYQQVENEIAASPSQAILRERQFEYYSRFIKLMNYMSTNYFAHEVVYCGYYGKENIQFVNDSIYRRFHEDRLLDGATLLPMMSDKPDITGDIFHTPGQDYMAVSLRTDTLPYTFQTARYYFTKADEALTSAERQRRQDYGLTSEFSPQGFFPIIYHGQRFLILPLPDSTVTRITIPLGITPQAPTITLTPAGQSKED